jgi:hypothetical protein
MRRGHRWGLAGIVTALALLTPYADALRPAHDPDVSTADLVSMVRSSGATSFSGSVDVQGRVGLPIADHFSDLADLFGGESRLRVWWRGSDDWRVDRLLTTGEVDLFHHENVTVSWDYERQEARTGPDPHVRLPRDSDLIPPAIATRALDGVPASAVRRLSARRVAGVVTAGLRVDTDDPRSSIDHVDLWVEPDTGVTLSVDVYGSGADPVLTSTFTSFSRATPDSATTRFRAVRGVRQVFDPVLDIADATDQFAPVRPPAQVAGFDRTNDELGAAGLYGTGLTRLMALPLPEHEAADLADQLRASGATRSDGRELLRVGPLGVTLTRTNLHDGTRWLLAGTVTDDTLARAAETFAADTRLR